jgi:hypothetical protein
MELLAWIAISDVFLVKAAVTVIAKGTITVAGKYALSKLYKYWDYVTREERNPI